MARGRAHRGPAAAAAPAPTRCPRRSAALADVGPAAALRAHRRRRVPGRARRPRRAGRRRRAPAARGRLEHRDRHRRRSRSRCPTTPAPAAARRTSHARSAVTAAKSSPWHLRVGRRRPRARPLETTLWLWAAVLARRTPRGWEVADLVDEGLSYEQAGRRLGISQSAVSQRAQAAGIVEGRRARELATELAATLLADGGPSHERAGLRAAGARAARRWPPARRRAGGWSRLGPARLGAGRGRAARGRRRWSPRCPTASTSPAHARAARSLVVLAGVAGRARRRPGDHPGLRARRPRTSSRHSPMDRRRRRCCAAAPGSARSSGPACSPRSPRAGPRASRSCWPSRASAATPSCGRRGRRGTGAAERFIIGTFSQRAVGRRLRRRRSLLAVADLGPEPARGADATQAGPTTARISGWREQLGRRARGSSSRVTRVDARQHLVDAEQLVVDQLGLAEAGHPRAGVLEPEHQPTAQLALAAGQLLVGDAVGGDLGQLGADDRQHRRRACSAGSRPRPRPGRRRRGGWRRRRPSRPARGFSRTSWNSRLDVPPPSAALSTPRAKRRSSERVSPSHAEHDVDLLERAGVACDHARRRPGGLGGLARRHRARSSRSRKPLRPNAAPHQAHERRRGRRCRPPRRPCAPGGSGAGRSATIWSRVSASIDSSVPAIGRPSGESPHACAAKRLCTTSSGSSSCIAISSRITSRSASTSSAVSSERGDHVAEHVDRQRQVLVEDPRVEAGVLLGGEGVELTADRVERDRDVERGALRGALEQQVLEEVRAAVQASATRRASRRRPTPRCWPSGRRPSAR